MTMRHSRDQPFATGGATIKPGHVRLGPALVNKYQLGWVQIRLLLPPSGTRLGNVGAILLGCMQRLFFTVRSSVVSVFHIRPVLAETLWVAASQDCNSTMVASGWAVT